MKIKLLIALILLSMFILVAWSWKFNLNEYEEECYEYKVHYWNETYCKNLWTFSFNPPDESVYKNTNENHPCCSNDTFNMTHDNGTVEEFGICMGTPFNISYSNTTDECIKYHLVKKV